MGNQLKSSTVIDPAFAPEPLLGTNYLTLPFRGPLAQSIAFVTPEFILRIANSEKPLVVLNFSYAEAAALSAGELKLLKMLCKACLDSGKRLAFVKCPDFLLQDLEQKLDLQGRFFSTLSQALKSGPEQVIAEIGPELELLTKAVIEVFEKQFSIVVIPEKPRMLTPASVDAKHENGIIGLIALNSKDAVGSLLMRFGESTVLKLAEQTYGEKLPLLNPQVTDVAAELINMILGCAKEELNARGFGIEQALPQTLVPNPDGGGSANTPKPCWQINFQSPVGELNLEICLKRINSAKSE